jgi:hypothetical protein
MVSGPGVPADESCVVVCGQAPHSALAILLLEGWVQAVVRICRGSGFPQWVLFRSPFRADIVEIRGCGHRQPQGGLRDPRLRVASKPR